MEFEIETEYDERIAKRSAWLFWKRTLGRWAVVAWIVAVTCGGLAVVRFDKQLLVLVGALGATIGLTLLMVFVTVRARSLDLLGAMASRTARWHFTEDGLELETSLARSTVKWSAVREIWLYPDVWLLFFSGLSYSTLPTQAVPPEVLRFIVDRVRAAGGRMSPDPDVTTLVDF